MFSTTAPTTLKTSFRIAVRCQLRLFLSIHSERGDFILKLKFYDELSSYCLLNLIKSEQFTETFIFI